MMESEYLKKLLLETPDVGERCRMKLRLINGLDPFLIKSQDLDYGIDGVPPISTMDIVSYLVFTHSFYTGEQMRVFKSLQAYKYFESGFVLQPGAKIINDLYVLVGKVKRSQKANLKPLEVWVIVTKGGSVCTAHCTCMAGNSEVCSHVGAILFAAEHANSRKQALSCTDLQAVWPMPSMSTQVPIVRVKEMDWGKSTVRQENRNVSPMSQQEIINMLQKCSEMSLSSTLMRVVEPFASKIAEETQKKMGSVMDIFSTENINKSYVDLMKMAKSIKFSVTREQINEIEDATKSQSENQNWYAQRAGRITASKFKLVCRTNKNKPSLSLIKSICYKTKILFTTKATSWGLNNEDNAVEEYRDYMEGEKHENFIINEVGVLISERWPQLAATPDRIVYCECCRGGCLEVKCPYLLFSNRVQDINEYIKMKSSCLVMNDQIITLDKNHSYYYQVQMQIFVTGLEYCDFVIWSPNIFFRERILPNWEFWNQHSLVALKYHSEVILPELLGRFFTREEGMAKIIHWCVCNGVDDGRPMIKCDGDTCETEWFHFECVGLNDTPNVSWFCKNCIPSHS